MGGHHVSNSLTDKLIVRSAIPSSGRANAPTHIPRCSSLCQTHLGLTDALPLCASPSCFFECLTDSCPVPIAATRCPPLQRVCS